MLITAKCILTHAFATTKMHLQLQRCIHKLEERLMKKITSLIEEVSECLDITPEETNERASRLVLLYNQSPNISSTYQLRYRKATPIKVLIALDNAIASMGGGNFYDEEKLLKETRDYYSVLFSGAYPLYVFDRQASQDVRDYWNRLKIFKILEQKGNKLGLASDYKQKYILMLSNTTDIQADNTYFKSMFTTLGCAVNTETSKWTKTPSEICHEVGEILHNKDLLATIRNPRQIESTHVDPLHEFHGVNFYATDSKKLGIPSVSPVKPSDVASYNPPVGAPVKATDEVLEILNEIAEHPFYSKQGLIVEHGRPAYEYIKNMNAINPSKSPWTLFTSANSFELIISKTQIKLIEDLTGKALRTTNLKPEFEPIYNAAADIYHQIAMNSNNGDPVKDVIAKALEEGKLKDNDIKRNERAVLEELIKVGGVEYNDGAYNIKNTRLVGMLSGILEQKPGKIAGYIKMTSVV